MVTRKQQIEQVAGLIAENIIPYANADENAEACAKAINGDQGWTFETSAPLGHTILHTAVVLSPSELAEAMTLAKRSC